MSSAKASISAITLQGVTTDQTPPTSPTNLKATVLSSSQITLSWTASSDPETVVSHYEIFRGGIKIGQTITTSFSDSGLLSGTSYFYQVSSVNGIGLQSPKSVVSVATETTYVLEKIPGDINGDGIVGHDDAMIVVKDIGKTSGFDPLADTNNDGKIDLFDLMLIGVNWLRTY
jgi:hypothetical protein